MRSTAYNLIRRLSAKPAVLFFALAAFAAIPSRAEAYLVRVSVKFILGPGGVRPMGPLSTNGHVNTQEYLANLYLCNSKSPYRIDVVEIVNVANRTNYFNFPCSAGALETVAQNDSAFVWRSNMINVYVTNSSCSGQCSFPSQGQTIVLGQGSFTSSMIHEIGHYMGLYHTHNSQCQNNIPCSIPGNDDMADTLPDNQNWTNKDQMAQWSYSKNYSNLTTSQKKLVDQSFGNVMSYHTSSRWTFTPLQNVRFHQTAAIYRSAVVNWSHVGDTSGVCLIFVGEAQDPEGDPAGLSVVFRQGDANGDDTANITDALAVLSWLFGDGAPPVCADAADVNDDGHIRIDDVLALLMARYQGAPTGRGVPLAEPTVDLSEDALDCQIPIESWFTL